GLHHPGCNAMTRIGQHRPEREEVPLDGLDHDGNLRRAELRSGNAEARVQLVDVPVRIHARIGLEDAGTVEEGGLPGITRARVDLGMRIVNHGGAEVALLWHRATREPETGDPDASRKTM